MHSRITYCVICAVSLTSFCNIIVPDPNQSIVTVNSAITMERNQITFGYILMDLAGFDSGYCFIIIQL